MWGGCRVQVVARSYSGSASSVSLLLDEVVFKRRRSVCSSALTRWLFHVENTFSFGKSRSTRHLLQISSHHRS